MKENKVIFWFNMATCLLYKEVFDVIELQFFIGFIKL